MNSFSRQGEISAGAGRKKVSLELAAELSDLLNARQTQQSLIIQSKAKEIYSILPT